MFLRRRQTEVVAFRVAIINYRREELLSPSEVVEKDFLEHRHMLLEIAAYLDRYDAAVVRTGSGQEYPRKLQLIDQALELLRTRPTTQGRTHALLDLFAQIG